MVCQFNLEDIELKGFVGPRPGAGQRPTLDIDALTGVYKPWDPRLQKLYAQTQPSDKSQDGSTAAVAVMVVNSLAPMAAARALSRVDIVLD